MISRDDPERDPGVPFGRELLEFTDAVLKRSRIEENRNRLIEGLGAAATVEAAALVAGFEAINRVADAAGTQLDPFTQGALTSHLSGLGIEAMRQD